MYKLELNNADRFILIIMHLILVLVYKIILPFGDEPDFQEQILRIQNKNLISYVYQLFNINLEYINNLNCELNDNKYKLIFSNINTCIKYNAHLLLDRLLPQMAIEAILIIPLLLYSVKYSNQLSDKILLTLLWPSVVYFLGNISNEQLVLVLLFLQILLIKNIYIFLVIAALLFYLDQGQAIVMAYFYINYFIINLIFINKNYKIIIMSYVSIVFVLTIIFKENNQIIIKYLNYRKLNDIFNVINYGGFYDNYYYHERLIVFFSSAILNTPSGVKSIISMITFLLFTLYYYTNKRILINKIYIKNILPVILTVMSIIYIIPTHSYAKYYVFMIPFILPITNRVNIINISIFIIFINIINIFDIIFKIDV